MVVKRNNNRKINKYIVAFVPNFVGYGGDAVNERQLIKTMSLKLREVDKVIIFHQIGVKQLIKSIRRKANWHLDDIKFITNIVLIPLPTIQVPILYLLFSMFQSVTIALLLVFLKMTSSKDFLIIYVRGTWNAIGFCLIRSLREKLIVKIPALIEDEIKSPCSKFMEYLVKYIDRIVIQLSHSIGVPSFLLLEKLVKRRLVKPKKWIEIPAGVDMSLVEEIRKSTSNVRDVLYKNVGFIGSLFWWQGVDLLVKALKIVTRKIPNVRLVIIGDGPLKNYIERLCKSMGIEYEITGFLTHGNALRKLTMLNVLVTPSLRISTTESNFPIKVIEAWALGIPVIITKHEILVKSGIKNFEHVVYCEPNPGSVASAIMDLLLNPSLRNKISKSGQSLAKKFDYDIIVSRVLKAVGI